MGPQSEPDFDYKGRISKNRFWHEKMNQSCNGDSYNGKFETAQPEYAIEQGVNCFGWVFLKIY